MHRVSLKNLRFDELNIIIIQYFRIKIFQQSKKLSIPEDSMKFTTCSFKLNIQKRNMERQEYTVQNLCKNQTWKSIRASTSCKIIQQRKHSKNASDLQLYLFNEFLATCLSQAQKWESTISIYPLVMGDTPLGLIFIVPHLAIE